MQRRLGLQERRSEPVPRRRSPDAGAKRIRCAPDEASGPREIKICRQMRWLIPASLFIASPVEGRALYYRYHLGVLRVCTCLMSRRYCTWCGGTFVVCAAGSGLRCRPCLKVLPNALSCCPTPSDRDLKGGAVRVPAYCSPPCLRQHWLTGEPLICFVLGTSWHCDQIKEGQLKIRRVI